MTAPARRARSCVAASSWAVMNTTGMRRPAATRRSCSSNPLSPPRWTSRTKQPGVWGLWHSRKSSADAKVLTWKPPAPRRRRRALSSEASSSITHTSGERSSWRVEADADAKRPSLPGSTLEPVTPLRHALLVPYERVDWPGSRVLRVGRGRAVARQLDTECEPAIGVGFRHDTAAVGLDDRAADGQAHAEAARLRADEALEHALELRRFRADAGVADADLHAAGRPRRRYDPDLAGPVRGNTDRLARVHDQIQDHLLELDGIAGDERHDRVGGVDQRDVLARQVVAQQAHHLVDDLVQIEAALRRVLLAREGAEAPDDRRGALGVGGDVGQRLGHVGMYEARALEQAHRRLRVGHDGGERLVDLVGERGAELAERRDALGVRQPLALPAGLVLGVPPPRDVDVRDDRAAVRAPERLDRHLEPALDRLDATGVLEPRVVLLAGEDGGDGLEHAGRVAVAGRRGPAAGVEKVDTDRCAARRIDTAFLGEACPGVIDGDDDAVTVDRRDLPVQRAEDGAPKRRALEYGAECDVQRGDVDDGADVAREVSVLVDSRHPVIEHPPVVPVPAAQPVVERERAVLAHRGMIGVDREAAVVRMHAVGPALAEILVGPPAGQLQPAPIEVRPAGVGPGHPDHQRRRVGDRGEPVLAVARGSFGPMAG